MSGYDRAVWWVTERFEGVEPAYRRDVALTTGEVTAHAGLYARAVELVALVGLWLQLRSRRRTGSRAEAVWRQGLYIGGGLLLAMLAAQTWASLADPASPVVTFGAGIALAASLGLCMRGRRWAAAVLAAGGAAAYIGAGAIDPATFGSSCVVAVGGLLVGSAPTVPAGRRRAVAASVLVLAAWPLALAVGADATVTAVSLAFTGIGALVLVGLGWFDPRLAAAATVLVFSRLAASGLGELGQALAVLAENGRHALLVRWMVMGAGVLGAWFATQRSIRRLETL